jgi:hypothetical protein
MFSFRTQPRLLSHLIQVRPFHSRRPSPRLGGLALHCALPSYGRCTISNYSEDSPNTPAPVTQAWEHRSLIEARQNKLESIDLNPKADPASVFTSTIDSREPLLDPPSRERPQPTKRKKQWSHRITVSAKSSNLPILGPTSIPMRPGVLSLPSCVR